MAARSSASATHGRNSRPATAIPANWPRPQARRVRSRRLPARIPGDVAGETRMRSTAMLFRNLVSMDAEESIRADLPTIGLSWGPPLSGNWRGQPDRRRRRDPPVAERSQLDQHRAARSGADRTRPRATRAAFAAAGHEHVGGRVDRDQHGAVLPANGGEQAAAHHPRLAKQLQDADALIARVTTATLPATQAVAHHGWAPGRFDVRDHGHCRRLAALSITGLLLAGRCVGVSPLLFASGRSSGSPKIASPGTGASWLPSAPPPSACLQRPSHGARLIPWFRRGTARRANGLPQPGMRRNQPGGNTNEIFALLRTRVRGDVAVRLPAEQPYREPGSGCSEPVRCGDQGIHAEIERCHVRCVPDTRYATVRKVDIRRSLLRNSR
jgi:hypothetical protein